jgi:hypothetical protein
VSSSRKKYAHLACASLFLALLLAGCTLSPLAYPRFWDYTKVKPNDADMLGTYTFLKSSGSFGYGHGYQGNRDISVTLHADHTASLSEMPSIEPDQYKTLCTYSGPAVWALDDHGDPDGDEWYVMIETKQSADSKKKTWGPFTWWELLMLSRRPPYRLYKVIGDPDNDTGLEFGRALP